MTESAIAVLSPDIGQAAACRAVGRSRATHHRRHLDHGMEAVDLSLQLDPDRPVPPLGQQATDVEVVIEGPQPALRRAECATHGPVIACACLCEQRLSYGRRRQQPEHELLHEFVNGIGDDPQLMPGPTSSAEVAPRACR